MYLLSHNRPMSELLSPVRLDISKEFTRGFDGMTEVPVTLDELLETREELTANVVEKMPMHHRRFLISAKRGEPDWSLLELPGMEALPAVRWKLENLAHVCGMGP